MVEQVVVMEQVFMEMVLVEQQVDLVVRALQARKPGCRVLVVLPACYARSTVPNTVARRMGANYRSTIVSREDQVSEGRERG